ncbi:MAG: glycosyltransferase family 10 [Candidatus Omnitrophota bacterium]
MKVVRIFRNWPGLGFFPQTPGGKGVWDNIRFTEEPVEECDHVITLNYANYDAPVFCPPENIWSLQQEPPAGHFKPWHNAHQVYRKVFTSDVSLIGERYIHSHPAIGWWAGRNYDFLNAGPVPEKTKNLSWITSNKQFFELHRKRIAFLKKIQTEGIEFDLFGKGFFPIEKKWDGLAPYRYSLAIENYQGPFYWSEKLADCFLAWTMPVYFGCTNIEEYFPKESFVPIEIDAPGAIGYLKEIIKSDLWLKNREAIAYARELVLNRYQFFPYMTEQIRNHEKERGDRPPARETVVIPGENESRNPPKRKKKNLLHRIKKRLRSLRKR